MGMAAAHSGRWGARTQPFPNLLGTNQVVSPQMPPADLQLVSNFFQVVVQVFFGLFKSRNRLLS